MTDESMKNCKTSRKDRAILALLEYATVEKAAEAVGVHPSTLRRWLRKAEFQEVLRHARRERFSQSMGRLQHAANPAVSILLKIMMDPNEPGSTRVRAVERLLDRTAKAIENDDLAARVTVLEKQAGTRGRA